MSFLARGLRPGRAAAGTPARPHGAPQPLAGLQPRPRLLGTRRAASSSGDAGGSSSSAEQQPRPPAGLQQQAPPPGTSNDASASSSSSGREPIATSTNGAYSLMAALAGVGALETSYLAATKLLLHTSAACPTHGCDAVLNSPYGSLFGLPLPLYGAATYAAVALAAGLSAASVSAGRPVPAWLHTCLAGGVGVLATTSAALMAILATQLGGAPCLWCYASAGLSGGLLATFIASLGPRASWADTAAPGLGGTAAAAAALLLGFGPLLGSPGGASAELELAFAEPVVTGTSSETALALARRLAASGAKMYGAFWCSHCYDQKQEFGAQAMADFPYVECFPEGWRKGVKIAPACEAAGVKAFPTWVIGGRVSEGQLELSALSELLDSQQAEAAAAAADGGSSSEPAVAAAQ